MPRRAKLTLKTEQFIQLLEDYPAVVARVAKIAQKSPSLKADVAEAGLERYREFVKEIKSRNKRVSEEFLDAFIEDMRKKEQRKAARYVTTSLNFAVVNLCTVFELFLYSVCEIVFTASPAMLVEAYRYKKYNQLPSNFDAVDVISLLTKGTALKTYQAKFMNHFDGWSAEKKLDFIFSTFLVDEERVLSFQPLTPVFKRDSSDVRAKVHRIIEYRNNIAHRNARPVKTLHELEDFTLTVHVLIWSIAVEVASIFKVGHDVQWIKVPEVSSSGSK